MKCKKCEINFNCLVFFGKEDSQYKANLCVECVSDLRVIESGGCGDETFLFDESLLRALPGYEDMGDLMESELMAVMDSEVLIDPSFNPDPTLEKASPKKAAAPKKAASPKKRSAATPVSPSPKKTKVEKVVKEVIDRPDSDEYVDVFDQDANDMSEILEEYINDDELVDGEFVGYDDDDNNKH